MTTRTKALALDAATYDSVQKCARIYKIRQTHDPLKHNARALFASIVRKSVTTMSSAAPPTERVIQLAVNQFLASARDPGLDVPQGADPYTLAQDYIAVIRTFLTYVSTLSLLQLTPMDDIELPGEHHDTWRFTAWHDDSGVLHFWHFADVIDADEVYAAIHSNFVWADMALAKAPAELHMVAIGRASNSHLSTPWCRIYESVSLHNAYRFQKKTGEALTDSWKPKYFAENPANSAEDWIERMRRDNVFDNIVKHIKLNAPSSAHAAQFEMQLAAERNRMRFIDALSQIEWIPMTRRNCDNPTCSFQDACYSQVINLDQALRPRTARSQRFTGTEVLSA